VITPRQRLGDIGYWGETAFGQGATARRLVNGVWRKEVYPRPDVGMSLGDVRLKVTRRGYYAWLLEMNKGRPYLPPPLQPLNMTLVRTPPGYWDETIIDVCPASDSDAFHRSRGIREQDIERARAEADQRRAQERQREEQRQKEYDENQERQRVKRKIEHRRTRMENNQETRTRHHDEERIWETALLQITTSQIYAATFKVAGLEGRPLRFRRVEVSGDRRIAMILCDDMTGLFYRARLPVPLDAVVAKLPTRMQSEAWFEIAGTEPV